MKSPQWFRELLAGEGRRVLQRTVSNEEAAAELARAVLDKDDRDDPPFTRRIVADYVRRQLKSWLSGRSLGTADGDPDGQLDLFPEIPRHLEVAPGRFVDQAAMTRRDWTAAIKQAKTKASNAGNFAGAIEQAAEKVLPLLTDDTLTTADVWQPGQASGTAAGGS